MQMPWGIALLAALKECAHVWVENRHLLGTKNGGGSNNKNFATRANQNWQATKANGAAGSNGNGNKANANGAKTVLCRFFSAGKCTKGNECTFIHQGAKNNGNKKKPGNGGRKGKDRR